MSHDIIQIYRETREDGTLGKWRFRRRARNGEIGNPSQPYARRWNALVGAARWNPDIYRENVVDLTRGGLRVRSKALRWLRSRDG